MTSIIKVDQIQNAAGGVPTAADLGLNVSGTVLQIQHAFYNVPAGGAYISTTSTTYLALSPLSVTITPKFATSNLLLECFYHFDDESSTSNGLLTAFYRDGSNISTGGYSGSSFIYNSPAGDHYTQVVARKLIPANNTSATTIVPYVRCWDPYSIRVMSHGGDCTMTVTEIAG